MVEVENGGFICAYLFDGEGGGKLLDAAAMRAWKPEDGFLWVHIDRAGEDAVHWLRAESGLPPIVRDAILMEDTRPRAAEFEDGLIVILRGVNLNPSADPEDMVSIRLWIDGRRVISVRLRRLMAVADIRAELSHGRGPKGPADFLAFLAARLADRMGPVIESLEDTADGLEEQVVERGRRRPAGATGRPTPHGHHAPPLHRPAARGHRAPGHHPGPLDPRGAPAASSRIRRPHDPLCRSVGRNARNAARSRTTN